MPSFRQLTLPVSVIVPKGTNETTVFVLPIAGTNHAGVSPSSHMYLSLAHLTEHEASVEKKTRIVAKLEPGEEEEEEGEWQAERAQRDELKMEAEDWEEDGDNLYEIGVALKLNAILDDDATVAPRACEAEDECNAEAGETTVPEVTFSPNSIVTFQPESLGLTVHDALKAINGFMLKQSPDLFAYAPFFVDWVDNHFRLESPEEIGDEVRAMEREGGYGSRPLKTYGGARVPPGANPYLLPPSNSERFDQMRLRLHLSAGLKVQMSTMKHLEKFGFDVAPYKTAMGIASAKKNAWTVIRAKARPDVRLSSLRLRIDVDKAPAIPTILLGTTFSVSDMARRDNDFLLYHVQNALRYLERETNIRLGLRLKPNDKFEFHFPTDRNVSIFTYGLSDELQERLQAPSTTVESTTVLGADAPAPTFANEEEVATQILNAEATGLVYVCSPQGRRDDFFPGKVIGILEPKRHGGYSLTSSGMPFVVDGSFLDQLPDGRLRLRFFTHSPTDQEFHPLLWHRDLKLQGNLVLMRAE